MGQIVFLYFLQKKGWLGVQIVPDKLTEQEYNEISNKTDKDSILFKLFSGLISILTFLSVVITIVIGWNQFIEIIKGIINIKQKKIKLSHFILYMNTYERLYLVS